MAITIKNCVLIIISIMVCEVWVAEVFIYLQYLPHGRCYQLSTYKLQYIACDVFKHLRERFKSTIIKPREQEFFQVRKPESKCSILFWGSFALWSVQADKVWSLWSLLKRISACGKLWYRHKMVLRKHLLFDFGGQTLKHDTYQWDVPDSWKVGDFFEV